MLARRTMMRRGRSAAEGPSGVFYLNPRGLWRPVIDAAGDVRFQHVLQSNFGGGQGYVGNADAAFRTDAFPQVKIGRYPVPMPDPPIELESFMASRSGTRYLLRNRILSTTSGGFSQTDWTGSPLPSVAIPSGFSTDSVAIGDGSAAIIYRDGRRAVGFAAESDGVGGSGSIGWNSPSLMKLTPGFFLWGAWNYTESDQAKPFGIIDSASGSFVESDTVFDDSRIRAADIPGPPVFHDDIHIHAFHAVTAEKGRTLMMARFRHYVVKWDGTSTFVTEDGETKSEAVIAVAGCYGVALLEIRFGAPVIRRVLQRTRFTYPQATFIMDGSKVQTTEYTSGPWAAYRQEPQDDPSNFNLLPPGFGSILTPSISARAYRGKIYIVDRTNPEAGGGIYALDIDGEGPARLVYATIDAGADIIDLRREGYLVVGTNWQSGIPRDVHQSRDGGASWKALDNRSGDYWPFLLSQPLIQV